MPSRVVCVGGAVVDLLLRLQAPAVLGSSNPADGLAAAGGVARNVAENLSRLGLPVSLVARVGRDGAADQLVSALRSLGIDTAAVVATDGSSTAHYVAVLDPDGELVIGVADMAVLERLTGQEVRAAWPRPTHPGLAPAWVFADCNPDPSVVAVVVELARTTGVPLAVDAVSTAKVRRLPADLDGVRVWFGNRDEAAAYLRAEASDVELAQGLRRAGAASVVLTRGVAPVLVADANGCREVVVPPADVVDVTGAGDALVAATLAALTTGRGLDDAVADGVAAAALTLASPVSVRTDLSPQLIANRRSRT
jgi:pseudouridine kinase